MFLSFNNGKSNFRLPSAVRLLLCLSRLNKSIQISDEQARLVESRRSDGQLYCRVKQRIQAMQVDSFFTSVLNEIINIMYRTCKASTISTDSITCCSPWVRRPLQVNTSFKGKVQVHCCRHQTAQVPRTIQQTRRCHHAPISKCATKCVFSQLSH